MGPLLLSHRCYVLLKCKCDFRDKNVDRCDFAMQILLVSV